MQARRHHSFFFSSRPCGEETEVTPKTKANRATPRRTHKSAYGGSQVCAWLQEGGRMLQRRCCWRLRVRQGSSECHYPHIPPRGASVHFERGKVCLVLQWIHCSSSVRLVFKVAPVSLCSQLISKPTKAKKKNNTFEISHHTKPSETAAVE